MGKIIQKEKNKKKETSVHLLLDSSSDSAGPNAPAHV